MHTNSFHHEYKVEWKCNILWWKTLSSVVFLVPHPTLTNKIHIKMRVEILSAVYKKILSKMHYRTREEKIAMDLCFHWGHRTCSVGYRHGWIANKRENCHIINSFFSTKLTLKAMFATLRVIFMRKKIVFLRMAEQQRESLKIVFAKKAINKALP